MIERVVTSYPIGSDVDLHSNYSLAGRPGQTSDVRAIYFFWRKTAFSELPTRDGYDGKRGPNSRSNQGLERRCSVVPSEPLFYTILSVDLRFILEPRKVHGLHEVPVQSVRLAAVIGTDP